VDGPIFHSQPEFGKWYERIARWLNKHYTKIDELIRAGAAARALWTQYSFERSKVQKGQIERLCSGFLQGGIGLTEEWLRGNLRSSEFPEVIEAVLREHAAEYQSLNRVRYQQLVSVWKDVRSKPGK
jgi:hypothetical protein